MLIQLEKEIDKVGDRCMLRGDNRGFKLYVDGE
jgi:hypothetical protein